jgi:AcrR family transcriptional regulator
VENTRDRILDEAEKLFAEQGFSGTSLRQITAAAQANLAAVNYHFGSKERLIAEVFSRRFEPINAIRLRLLDVLEAEGNEPTVEQIVEVFLDPPLRACLDPERGESLLHISQMIGHAMSRPDSTVRDVLLEQLEEIVERFTRALGRQLNDLPPDQLLWRFVFMIGAMAHTMSISPELKHLTKGLCDPSDVEGLVSAMVPFVAAGFRAEAP